MERISKVECILVGSTFVLYIHTRAHTHCSNSTFVHQCTHHKCVKWGYYCHIADRLAAPVLITLFLPELQALLFYLRDFWQLEVCKLSSVPNFHSSGCQSWELSFQARAQDNKAFFHQDELTNSQAGRRLSVEGQAAAWEATAIPSKLCTLSEPRGQSNVCP